MKRVGIVAGGISRFDLPRHTLQEEMCAEAMKMILDDVPELELSDFVKKGYAWVNPYYPGWWTYYIEATSIYQLFEE